ncbi:DUF1700 domain-containing protein [Alkalicoccobacillus gibsonii]|uniref:DUF1700 domain-containing protein n=1 Tax=Alkalicoccobacillus gibsonii TaxID=79881 RepID=A0ABU9VNC8_9BACI
MKQSEFLKALRMHLTYMSEQEKNEIIREYAMHFKEGEQDNEDAEKVSRQLGDPRELAKELNAVHAVRRVEEKKSLSHLFHAVVSIGGLSIWNLFVMFLCFGLLLLVSPVVFAFVIAVPIMIASPVILLVLGFVFGFDMITLKEITEVTRAVIIGSALAVVGYLIAKALVSLFIRHLKWNVSLLKRERVI